MATKLVLFDGNAIMHRAYHALPPLTTKKGKPINAVYGLVSMLLRVVADHEPTHIVFAFDTPKPTFRKKLMPDYQGHRPKMDNELSTQFNRAYKVLKKMGIPVILKPGYEADDVIGTISSSAKVDHVIVVTGDKDMLQLVTNKTKLLMPGRGLSNSKLYGARETREKMGVAPDRIVDLKGLIGDPSDNYKGVPGVGPKTGERLLTEFGSFKNIYNNLGKLPEKQQKLLTEHKESADMSYKLAKIITDVPLKFDLTDARKWRVDDKDVLELFDKFGFKTLTRRVREAGAQVEESRQQSLI